MAISKRRNSWQVSVTLNGQRVRRSFKNHADAQLFEAEVTADLMAGRDTNKYSNKSKKGGVPITVGGMANHIYEMEWKYQKSADHTFNRVQKVVKYFGETTPLEAITPYTLEAYMLHLRSVENNGPATINRKLAVVSKIMNYAHRHQIIKFKPKAPAQREPDGRIKWYTEEEESVLLEKMHDWHDSKKNHFDCLFDFFSILIDTGMRRGELLSLEWADVDFDNRMIVLPDPDQIKASKPRSIPMTGRVEGLLLRRSTNKQKPKPFAFTTHQIDNEVQKFKDKCFEISDEPYMDIEDVALFHTCRHTFISRLIQKGVPLTVVKELAGHRNISTTMRYAHLAPSNFNEAISLLEKKEA